MDNQFIRTQMLFGEDYINVLAEKKVAVFGVGGVGGYTVEALARTGVGAIDIFDHDVVSLSNINRQIIALHSTIGEKKVDVMKQRVLDINPACKITAYNCFFNTDTEKDYPFTGYDFVVDAIDTVSSKLLLLEKANQNNVPIIACMGTGNKTDPTKLKIEKLEKTTGCPLARVMRYECKKRNIKNVTVLCSTELPVKPIPLLQPDAEGEKTKPTPASTAFVPSVAGLIIASHVVKKLLGNDG